MKKGLYLLQVTLLILSLASTGCTGAPVRFQALGENKYDTTKGKAVTGSACGFQLLLVLPININSQHQRAYDELLNDAGTGYYVTDIKVQEKWWYAFVGTVYCTNLEAMAYPYQLPKMDSR